MKKILFYVYWSTICSSGGAKNFIEPGQKIYGKEIVIMKFVIEYN